MELFRLIQKLENDVPSKLSRLLILIYELAGGGTLKGIDSISKLSKLDFLMANPIILMRVVKKSVADKKISILPHERDSIESKLCLYRYNPWSLSYRGLINILISKGLLLMEVTGNNYQIKVTELGATTISKLYELPCFYEYKNRAKLINTYLGKYSDDYVRSYFSKILPELSNLNNDDYENTL